MPALKASPLYSSARPNSISDEMALSRLMEALFLDPDRQNESLALLSAAALREGRFDAAFMFADRRCRRPTPSARDFLLRATASRLIGYEDSAAEDLARAFEIDPTDETVASAALSWGPRDLRPLAAASVIAGVSEDRETLALALRALESVRVSIASRLRDHDGMYSGWVAWPEQRVLELRIRRGGVDSSFLLDSDPMHPLASHGWSAAEIAIEVESPRLQSVSFCLDGKLALRTCPTLVSPERAEKMICAGSIDSNRAAPKHVDIIVPVYENYNATKACLDSLVNEGSHITKHVIVIDDCTPNEELRALIEERASRGQFTLLRNDENLGFAQSVNSALARRYRGDVLLLNADTLLPRGAIDRLACAAYSQADIGTVTPLSNNGEFTSFPKPNVANALRPIDEIQFLDDMARAANGAEVVDLPNGIGFCLYISRACADAVGHFSNVYSRGYYEDVEFCLKARELGFRNVCATGVFVGHAGASSFRDEKRALVVRNLAILEARFPEHRLECGAFLKADPLAPARGKLEERLAPEGPVVLLIGPARSAHALVLERALQIETAETELHCVRCEFIDADSRAIIRSLRGSVPQSLTFAISDPLGLVSLESYFRRLRLEAVEVFDPQSLPEAVLPILSSLRAPLRVAFGDLRWICGGKLEFEKLCSNDESRGGCDRCCNSRLSSSSGISQVEKRNASQMRELLRHAEAIIPLDRMASAFSNAYLKPLVVSRCLAPRLERAAAPAAKPAPATLGVICPEATGETDRQILTLGRIFLQGRIDASIVVLGQCIDELGIMASGNIFITGAIARKEYAQVIKQYRIGKLFSPYRTRHFGFVDNLGTNCGLQKGYFDWSFGSLEIDEADLALDPRICAERAALEIGAWLLDESVDWFRR